MMPPLAALAALALALPASAQGPGRAYRHQDRSLVVYTFQGRTAPDAVFYDTPAGKFLIRDAELYALGRDYENREERILRRENIYNLRAEGVEYAATSDVAFPILTRWDDPAVAAVLDSLIESLKKEQAEPECRRLQADLEARSKRDQGRLNALASMEKLMPGAVKDPAKLEEAKGKAASADAALGLAGAICAPRDGDGGFYFWRASSFRTYAGEELEKAENVLDWLLPPAR